MTTRVRRTPTRRPRAGLDFNEAIRAVSLAANSEDGPTEGGAAAPRPHVIPSVPDTGVGPAPVPGEPVQLDEGLCA